ncbi:unnamed protein product [Candida verbasci]|uniref:Mannosyltransferase n=1 Tax=Candida verbasci TaxID=1227364 RepID=A0A9W4XCV3_9ASCO|nr:unnamed protein product [Candida verbasci]
MLLSLRKRKVLYILLAIFTIFITSDLLSRHKIIDHSKLISDDWSIESLTNKYDFSYLKSFGKSSTFNDEELKSTNEELNKNGYILKPQNVQFKFLNNIDKKGSREEIIDGDNSRYQQLMKLEIGKPQDASLINAPEDVSKYNHANATILILVTNEEITKIGQSIRKFEKSFNSKFQYPYTFLNDQPFNDRFKQRIKKYTGNAPVEFVTIPKELWDKPTNIDEEKESKAMEIMYQHDVAYAKKGSYHNMCRFYSMNFYKVPELAKYKYYWRIEPNVHFYTDIQYDVFKYMESTGKIYGFTISLYDIEESIKTLWPETLHFLNQDDNYKLINPNGGFQFLLEDLQNPNKNKVAGYSTCHFWSNFEIGDMDFYRSKPYDSWVNYLDSTGKFYYERWGDAPIHSIGVSLFADKSKVHWFRDIGYLHDPYYNYGNI